tara:strand:+ start:58605 stop:59162 length:558 start_codon:yes stop_codon:yes gene_type:complete
MGSQQTFSKNNTDGEQPMENKNSIGATEIGAVGVGSGGVIKQIEEDQLQQLNHLIHLANDLCLAYGTARRRLENSKLIEIFTDLDKSHDRFRIQLGECVTNLGHTPPETGDLHSMIERGRVVIGELQGDEGIVRAMAKNEEELADAFREAILDQLLPANVLEIVKQALAHEDSHRAYYNKLLRQF